MTEGDEKQDLSKGGAVIDSSYRLKNPKFDDFRFPYRLKL